jgi:UDP-N-acetylglucosamine acyltransferase
MIDPLAVVSPNAVVHADVSIGPFCVIGDDVEIGKGSRIESHTVVKGPTRIGEGNHIFQYASIGGDPQDKKYAGEATRLEIGDRNTIREGCTINRGTAQDLGVTTIGSDNWIMAYVHVAHDCVLGDNIIIANNTALGGHVQLDDWVIVGGNCGIHQFSRVGAHAFVGMHVALGKDLPAYVMAFGSPPVPRGINAEGLKRRGFDSGQIRNIREAYRLVYRQGLKLGDAVAQLQQRVESQPEIEPFLASIGDSQRSILR